MRRGGGGGSNGGGGEAGEAWRTNVEIREFLWAATL